MLPSGGRVSFQLQEAYPKSQIATQPAQQVQLPQTVTPQVQRAQPLPSAQLPAANAVSRLASHVSHVSQSTLEPRRLVARVGAPSAPAALGLHAHVQAVQAVLTAPGPAPATPATPATQAQPRTLRFADEPSRPMQPPVQPAPVQPPPQAVQCAQAAPKSLLRRSTASAASAVSEEAPVSCNALAPYSRDARSCPNGQARRRKSLPEPELLVVKFLYLSRLPAASWLQTPSQYQLSLHVGEDARNDPPGRPGVYSTPSVQLGNIKRFGIAKI